MSQRLVIVVADDLGYDPAIDEGILEAHRRGVVTAASALVDGPFAEAALRGAPGSLAVGLHLRLPPGLDRRSAGAEVERQLRRFQEVRGAPPTHVDGHKHVHREPAVLAALLERVGPLHLRVRALDAAMRLAIREAGGRACDHFLGDAALRPCWTAGRLEAALRSLPDGTTEVMTHPGRRPSRVATSFGVEREVELAAALAPAVRQALEAGAVELVGALPG